LIFTEAGKPVYTRYGDEMVLAPFFATLSAIIPKITNYFVENQHAARDQQNRIKWINTHNFEIAVLKKGNFFYICLSNNLPHKYLDDENTKTTKSMKVRESSSLVRK